MGKGEAFALASALAWAFGVILYKRLGERLPPLRLNLGKNLLVLGMVLAWLLVRDGLAAWPLGSLELAVCLLSGLLGIALADTLYLRALNAIGAGRMGIVGNFYSPFVLVLAALTLGERLDALQFAGFGLVTLGVVIVSGPFGVRSVERDALRRGVVLGALSVALMAAAIVMVKPILERHDVFQVSAVRLVGGVAGMLVARALLRDDGGPMPALDARGWLMLLVAALVGQFVAQLLWLAGYKYTSASVAAILNETSAVFIVLLAALLLREPFTRRKLAGVVFTLGGVSCMLL